MNEPRCRHCGDPATVYARSKYYCDHCYEQGPWLRKEERIRKIVRDEISTYKHPDGNYCKRFVGEVCERCDPKDPKTVTISRYDLAKAWDKLFQPAFSFEKAERSIGFKNFCKELGLEEE